MPEIFIEDRLIPKDGMARAVLDLYSSEYFVSAEKRGMTLKSKWISPPLLLRSPYTNTLSFTWSVSDLPAWWRQRLATSFDPEMIEFWKRMDDLLVSRERNVHEEVTNHV